MLKEIDRRVLIGAAAAVIFFTVGAGMFIYSNNISEMKIKGIKSEVDVAKKKLAILKVKIEDLKKERDDKSTLYYNFKAFEKCYYLYSDRNEFINDFGQALKNHKDVQFLKLEYTKIEEQKRLKISIPIIGKYRDIREFIFDIEKRFNFIKVTSVSVYKAENTLKGSIDIIAYFGDDKSE